MRRLDSTLLAVLLVVLGAQSSMAHVQFQKQWVEMYIDKDDKSPENKAYIKLVAKGKDRCLVCHQGKKRHNYNPYGQHFVGNLTEDDKKDNEKIAEWLTKVGKMHSDPDDESSPTYNERIADRKFPGGEVEELRKPVEGDDDADDADDEEDDDDE
ncbi:hypothetical protein NG895_14890 [Aeoliella sp. ICT_H6.2]|uniref:Cytochrome c domain-containing protein n=1 Tax=Aeoliella straminimaris TaxID=2954799 RepID=A0A9X2FHQ0_9BACT|nr:hypothetical protein [Aeoliella straminimaris]MCO6045196.1 hypothetical protein [Aeoliella straminimaris]